MNHFPCIPENYLICWKPIISFLKGVYLDMSLLRFFRYCVSSNKLYYTNMYFNFRYSNYLSMYSIVHFTLENSVSVVCSKWIFGYESNHMCYFPKKNQRKLLKENADVDINWPSFSCKINTISYTKLLFLKRNICR